VEFYRFARRGSLVSGVAIRMCLSTVGLRSPRASSAIRQTGEASVYLNPSVTYLKILFAESAWTTQSLKADRDDKAVADPRRFDLRRAALRSSIAFGRCMHFCIGQGLSRIAAWEALAAAFAELPGGRLASAPEPTGVDLHLLPELHVLRRLMSSHLRTCLCHATRAADG